MAGVGCEAADTGIGERRGMEKQKKESVVKDYTTVEGQLKMLRALLLATLLFLAIIIIRYQSQYLELKEKYQLLAESDRLLFESNQLLFESDRLILEQLRKIQDSIGTGRPDPEEIPSCL